MGAREGRPRKPAALREEGQRRRKTGGVPHTHDSNGSTRRSATGRGGGWDARKGHPTSPAALWEKERLPRRRNALHPQAAEEEAAAEVSTAPGAAKGQQKAKKQPTAGRKGQPPGVEANEKTGWILGRRRLPLLYSSSPGAGRRSVLFQDGSETALMLW